MEDNRPHQWRITPYLIYCVLIATLGPLQFGYHLVSAPLIVATVRAK